jgi:hypothetical protein
MVILPFIFLAWLLLSLVWYFINPSKKPLDKVEIPKIEVFE